MPSVDSLWFVLVMLCLLEEFVVEILVDECYLVIHYFIATSNYY